MLTFPADWIRHFGIDIASAFPPGLGARFRYYERLRPQPSFSTIVERMIASDRDFRVDQLGEMLRIVTVEGEYGAWVAIDGQRKHRRTRRYVGAVFMDDFATALDVVAITPQHFAEIERLSLELVTSQRFEMARRPRRFFYVPPADWQAIPSGLVANWYPLDFPKNRSTIVVLPASFVEGDALAEIEATLAAADAGLEIVDKARDTITSAIGVQGAYLRLIGKRTSQADPIHRDMAMYVVPPYAYRMRMETTNAARLTELRDVFRGVAQSFQALPTTEESGVGRAFAARTDLFDHWAR